MTPSTMVFWMILLRLLLESSLIGIGHSCTPSGTSPGVIVSLLKITRSPDPMSSRCRSMVSWFKHSSMSKPSL